MSSRRARIVESLEPRRLMAIELAQAAVSVDSDDDKMLQSLAAAATVAGGSPGRTAIVYADRDSGTGKGEDIYLRIIDATGMPIGSEALINITFSGAQMNPDIAMNDNGGTAIVWQSEGQDGDGWGIYMRVFTGGSFGPETLVTSSTSGDQVTPRVAIDDAGNIVVSWLDQGSNLGEIYARRFTSSGTAVGGAFKVSGSSTLAYAAPAVAMRGNGAFALAWESRDPNGDNTADVQFRAYDANGSAAGSAVTVNSVAAGDQAEPAIHGAGSGYVIAYSDNRDDQSRIYHRLYNASGSATSSPALTNQDADGDRTRPVVAGDREGNFVVGWTIQEENAVYSHSVLRSYDKNGVATGNELVEGDGSSARTLFDVVMTGTGTFREVASMSETVGWGVGTTAAYANVLQVSGTGAKNVITVAELNSGQTIRVTIDGIQIDYVRSAYAYLNATLGGDNDLFNAGTYLGNGGVTSLPVSVFGGDGADTIYGGAAGDWLFGESGTDLIYGGASKDYIVGGADNDTMFGEAGNDNLVGGAGKNRFDGGEGRDRLSGSGGHDTMNGGDDDDRLYGGAGNDSLDGGGGSDRIYAGDGNDILIGGSSNDRLYGENGDDTLIGGKGTDYLFGGAGTDTRKSGEASDILDSIEKSA